MIVDWAIRPTTSPMKGADLVAASDEFSVDAAVAPDGVSVVGCRTIVAGMTSRAQVAVRVAAVRALQQVWKVGAVKHGRNWASRPASEHGAVGPGGIDGSGAEAEHGDEA